MTGTLADKLKALGVATKDIQQFDVYSVPDEAIDFPEQRLGKTRKQHEKRFVIVLQNDRDNKDPLICRFLPKPASHS